MSSLLDILHRTDHRSSHAPETLGPVADSAAQTVELRLAIDNGPAPAEELAVATDIPTSPTPAAPPAEDPFATRLLTAVDLRRRSQRSSAWLGAGLVLIVLAAAVGTWLLQGDGVGSDDEGSQFTTPATVPTDAPAPQTVIAPPAVREKARAPQAAATDPTWFDTPASEAVAEPVAEPIRIVRGATSNPLFPKLSEAWAAFQAADYARAETLYREVRAADAGNIDALLGLGALAARGERTDEARDLYQAVLLAEPKNSTAVSALSTLPAAGRRNLDASTLKNLVREQPGAADLHFALGLQYVAAGNWSDAQRAFFEAVRNEPTNADYVYNLAVSLDRLGQGALAATYYQRALDVANLSALFNPDAARTRLATLRPTAP